MSDINQTTFSGTVVNGPYKFSWGGDKAGAAVLLKCTEKFRDKESWITVKVTAFSGTAAMVLGECAQGDRVIITGRLSLDKDKDGKFQVGLKADTAIKVGGTSAAAPRRTNDDIPF